jgi:hypothetical protein
LFRYDSDDGGCTNCRYTSRARDSYSRCATDCSDGSQAFVDNAARPPMPASPRYWVSATFVILFCAVHSPTSSCATNVTRWPSRDVAELVTTSIRPPPGRRMNSSPVFGITSASGPYSIIGRRAPKMLSVCSRLTAVSCTSGVGHGMPIGSPGSYS